MLLIAFNPMKNCITTLNKKHTPLAFGVKYIYYLIKFNNVLSFSTPLIISLKHLFRIFFKKKYHETGFKTQANKH